MFGTFIAILFSLIALLGIAMLAYVVYIRHDQLSTNTQWSIYSKTRRIQNEIDDMGTKFNTERLKLVRPDSKRGASLSTMPPTNEKISPPNPHAVESFVTSSSSSTKPSSPWMYLTNAAGSDYLEGGLAAASTWLRDSLLISDTGSLCIGSTCADTVAFGKMVNTPKTADSTMIQTTALNVLISNNGLPPSPKQSVVNLTFVGGNYESLVTSPVVNAPATFLTIIATAVQSQLTALGHPGVTVQSVGLNAGSIKVIFVITFPDGQSSTAGTAAFLSSVGNLTMPVSKASIGTYEIASVTGEDITGHVRSHIAVLASEPIGGSDGGSNGGSNVTYDSIIKFTFVGAAFESVDAARTFKNGIFNDIQSQLFTLGISVVAFFTAPGSQEDAPDLIIKFLFPTPEDKRTGIAAFLASLSDPTMPISKSAIGSNGITAVTGEDITVA